MERLIVIIGPTAVGKTQVSIELAKMLNSEIISGDSMLVYRDFDIGTAKPTLAERQGITHYLIDILGPEEEFSVAEFQRLASYYITRVNAKGKIPILAGGTGLYVKALLEGYKFNRAAGDEKFRLRLEQMADIHGNQYLYNMLSQVSPATAARLHPNDRRRIIRALEIYHLSGEEVSQEKLAREKNLIYDALVIGLNMNRSSLYERINQRVDQMVERGLINEVRYLLESGISPKCQAMQGIGYKEIVLYLKGEITLPEAIERIKKGTRNFAKRQLTWYRKMPYICWVQVDHFPDHNKLMEYIYSLVAGKFYL
ncbi:tRNA delta(2)-isopentenylpyrophosphate transferase [Thermosinus carboxydivorans Nor1]|uniref:tRNA dimethylallyltransferase n=1 Tax=Thermosinus carboxydivorans Nor1 TaxID=401526 RepID=A1HMU7_9FIRM|nr:tRNA (adenosine(37)-N6)-dimethylallyltransferase MiaA [Thermosinus carboxydivorans]EAX48580.1 tRNA delta(2)-isopentenylpyrophosphate transferase [Thermosinus carboxydivorans Nor1]